MDQAVSEKMRVFFSQFTQRTYKRGEVLIQASSEPAGLFYLKEGLVRQYAISASGEELTMNVFKSPSLFPMAWVVNDSMNSHYFEAMTPVTVWIAPKDNALGFIKNEPEVLFDLLKRIYRGLDGYFVRMENVMLGSAQARLIAEFLLYARRFGEQQGDGVKIHFKLTEKDLAAQSGIARETVSREIQKLKLKGLIRFEKHILTINNLPKLEEELLQM